MTFLPSITSFMACCVKPILRKLNPMSYNSSGVREYPSKYIVGDSNADEFVGIECSFISGTESDEDNEEDMP